MNYKHIHIGQLIHERVLELQIEDTRIEKFFRLSFEKINEMYASENISTDLLLKWCKLVEYDFFRLYSQHLTLYSSNQKKGSATSSRLPTFRKNIYTEEIKQFILHKIRTGQKSKQEVMEEYQIPKTTLYRWLIKDQQ